MRSSNNLPRFGAVIDFNARTQAQQALAAKLKAFSEKELLFLNQQALPAIDGKLGATYFDVLETIASKDSHWKGFGVYDIVRAFNLSSQDEKSLTVILSDLKQNEFLKIPTGCTTIYEFTERAKIAFDNKKALGLK